MLVERSFVVFCIFFHRLQEYVGNDGDNFLFLTNLDAPKHRVIDINVAADNLEWDSFAVVVEVRIVVMRLSGEKNRFQCFKNYQIMPFNSLLS